MMRSISKFIFLISLFYLSQLSGLSQNLYLSPFSLENDLRVLQLTNDIKLDHSFTIRPISFSKSFTPDSFFKKIDTGSKTYLSEIKHTYLKGKGKISLLPFRNITKFASDHPYGWSDGVLMPSRGLQTVFSTGFFLQFGPIVAQISPEILYSQNKEYALDNRWGYRRPIPNQTKLFFGQSKLAIEAGPVSFGISSENIWWGPGQFSSIMMSNNAPGFLHASFKTIRPVKTPIGNFEWQLIGGRLLANDTLPEDVYDLRSYKDIWGNVQVSGDYSKYINALALSYTPSFFKDITIGLNRSFIAGVGDLYKELSKKIGFQKTYLPIFDGLFKEKRFSFEDDLPWNQLASLYTRLRFRKIHAELYGEYGRNDHAFNMRDLVANPDHSVAFLIGFKKVMQLKQNRLLDFSVEYTQMSESVSTLVRYAGSWYAHSDLGVMSNYGEVLGSGIGYGADALTVAATIKKGFDQFGIKLEKVKRIPTLGGENLWTDFSLGLSFRKRYKKILLDGQITGIRSNNFIWNNSLDRFNVVAMTGVSYFF
jgi:hypothetical protein